MWPAFRDAWLSVAQGIAQSGTPTVLLGPLIPQHLEGLRARRWVGTIHYLALDCPDEIRRARIEARPTWRSRDITGQTQFGCWLRSNIPDHVDTSHGTPEDTAQRIATWSSTTSRTWSSRGNSQHQEHRRPSSRRRRRELAHDWRCTVVPADPPGQPHAVSKAVIDRPRHLVDHAAVHPDMPGCRPQQGPRTSSSASSPPPTRRPRVRATFEQGVVSGSGPGDPHVVRFALRRSLARRRWHGAGKLHRRSGFGRRRRQRLQEPVGKLGDRPTAADPVEARVPHRTCADDVTAVRAGVDAPTNSADGVAQRHRGGALKYR